MNYKSLYDQLPYCDTTFYSYDILTIKDSQKRRIDMPVVTKNCGSHPKSCLTLIEACNSIQTKQQIVCPCGKSVTSLRDLTKDIRQLAYEQFHPIVEQVQIIQGILFHKYNRKKKYLDCLKQLDGATKNCILNLYQQSERSNSISQMIQSSSNNQERFYFWAYCLLDKVKIVIPVRIKTCQHPECYELTSLLFYFQQQIKKRQQDYQNKVFKCFYPKCSQSLNITDLKTMIDGLALDRELLKILNQGYPAQIKFIYDPNTQTFQDNLQIERGVSIDPFIQKCYQVMVTPEEKRTIDYVEFQSQIQNQVDKVIQNDIPEQIQVLLKKSQFINKSINTIDSLTQLPIEIPVRCNQCQDLKKCIDARSLVAEFYLAKRRNQLEFTCQVCGFKQSFLQKTISSLIYFDQNLISSLYLTKQYQQQRLFSYNGKQYLLDLFLTKQKISSSEFLQKLRRDNKPIIQEISIPQNETQQIYIPLIIKDCPQNTSFDFETIYSKLSETNFELEKEQQSFCKCNYCQQTTIQSIYDSVFYHEALGEAFTIHQMSNLPDNTFNYNFETKQIIIIKKKNTDISQAFEEQQINSNIANSYNLRIGQIKIQGNNKIVKKLNGTIGQQS